MASLWPWIAVAGLGGAFHGPSPANDWMFATARGAHARDAAQARRALLPIAVGHATSVAVVACVFAQGMAMHHALVQSVAGALLACAAPYCVVRGTGRGKPVSTQTGHAGIVRWSFLMATAHGAGLMLVPALVPLCMTGNPAREIAASGSIVLALAAAGVHAGHDRLHRHRRMPRRHHVPSPAERVRAAPRVGRGAGRHRSAVDNVALAQDTSASC